MTDFAARLRKSLSRPVDNTFLVYFRVAFGGLLIWSLFKYFHCDLIWTHFLEPKIHFSWYGFDWVKPWPGRGMYLHFLVTAIAAACIMVGFRYRVAAVVFSFGFAYAFLIDQCWYLNHHYLICLFGILLISLPAHRAFSVDAWRDPALRSDTAPAWALWLLRFQVGLPYFFGGIAKLNSDWIHGEPLRTWLARRTDFPWIGSYFTEEWCVGLFVWGGLLLDLLVVPLLLLRPTRLPTLAAVWIFHLMNARLFNIGIFPWLMLVATTLVFLPVEWTARLRFWPQKSDSITVDVPDARTSPFVIALLSAFVAVQLALPLRHYLYPGPVAFTREGHCFAWRMKLNRRYMDPQLAVHFDDGSVEPVALWQWVTRLQSTRLRSNDQLLQLARFIREDRERETGKRAEVRGLVTVALNGRSAEPLVREGIDLSRQPRGIHAASWIERPQLPSLAGRSETADPTGSFATREPGR